MPHCPVPELRKFPSCTCYSSVRQASVIGVGRVLGTMQIESHHIYFVKMKLRQCQQMDPAVQAWRQKEFRSHLLFEIIFALCTTPPASLSYEHPFHNVLLQASGAFLAWHLLQTQPAILRPSTFWSLPSASS